MSRKRKHHSAEQIVKKLRDAETMLGAGKTVAEVVQVLAVSEQTYYRWKSKYGGMKVEEAKRLATRDTPDDCRTEAGAGQCFASP